VAAHVHDVSPTTTTEISVTARDICHLARLSLESPSPWLFTTAPGVHPRGRRGRCPDRGRARSRRPGEPATKIHLVCRCRAAGGPVCAREQPVRD
jgi:hypothetical protein